jgi:hypothetical protein
MKKSFRASCFVAPGCGTEHRPHRSQKRHPAPPARRPPLFEILAPDEFADVDDEIPAYDPEYRIIGNPEYNTRVSFRTGIGEKDFPTVSLRDRIVGGYAIRGDGFEIVLPDRPATKTDDRNVSLRQRDRKTVLVADDRVESPRAQILLSYFPPKRANIARIPFGRAEVRKDGLYFAMEKLNLQMRVKGALPPKTLQAGRFEKFEPGDVIETVSQLAPDYRPAITMGHTTRGALIGPAWVKGNWVQAFDPDAIVPWTKPLTNAFIVEWRNAGADNARERFGALSIDRGLQISAQAFTAIKGRQRHSELLAMRGSRSHPRTALPPRIALAVVSLPAGETLALGGWPRMSSSAHWQRGESGDVPPSDWLEQSAPRSLRRRYGGDRNFDRMIMGSSTKPILASSVLAVHPRVDSMLAVKGDAGSEDNVFGIPVTPPWHAPSSRSIGGSRWCDFLSYLALSDNRYHVRLGFLGLAMAGPEDKIAAAGGSGSNAESMDGGGSEWQQYPAFPDEIGFKPGRAVMRSLDSQPFAEQLKRMYGVGVHRGDVLRRYSFWTGDDLDDIPAESSSRHRVLAAISPESPQFALDRLNTPRQFVSLLLGGDENLWANVDFAGAFATCVTGRPVIPHCALGVETKTRRVDFLEIAKKMRPGLAATVESGTAATAFKKAGVSQFLRSMPGVYAYAKTGTLADGTDKPSMSRLVVAFIRWDGEKVEKGLVFSLAVERGRMGLAAEWLAEYIAENAELVRPLL